MSTVSPSGTPVPGQLTFVAPRRAKPARHLADLTMAERRAVVAELGEKPFRADQLSRHYFEKFNGDPGLMTDLPAAAREKFATALFPSLLTSVREMTTDAGTTRKTLWRLFDGALVESVLMRYSDRTTMWRVVAGRMRYELPVLRHRPGGSHP
ncbi:hypothetical protein GCM10018952_36070 [Streptosporangium vulgare]